MPVPAAHNRLRGSVLYRSMQIKTETILITIMFAVFTPAIRPSAASAVADVTIQAVCEEDFSYDIEYTLTNTGTGKEYSFTMTPDDGWRIDVQVPDGTYTAQAAVIGVKEEDNDADDPYMAYVEEGEKTADENRRIHFYALAGHEWEIWDYEDLIVYRNMDENGNLIHYGNMSFQDAYDLEEEYIQAEGEELAAEEGDTEAAAAVEERTEGDAEGGNTSGSVIAEGTGTVSGSTAVQGSTENAASAVTDETPKETEEKADAHISDTIRAAIICAAVAAAVSAIIAYCKKHRK